MNSIVLSLTTIPGRVSYLSAFLKSIEAQSLQPSQIELNLPTEYKFRQFDAAERSQIPSDFTVFDCEDVGPATKVLPTLKRYEGTEQKIIYCDDDRVYRPNWIEKLNSYSDAHPDTAIAEECNSIKAIGNLRYGPKKDWKYRAKRALSLGLYAPYNSKVSEGLCIVEGFGGVLVKPNFFDSRVFDVPQQVKPVDDVWLSANLALNGTPVMRTEKIKGHKSKTLNVDGIEVSYDEHALTTAVIDGKSRLDADCEAVKFCMENYGVWHEYRPHIIGRKKAA